MSPPHGFPIHADARSQIQCADIEFDFFGVQPDEVLRPRPQQHTGGSFDHRYIGRFPELLAGRNPRQSPLPIPHRHCTSSPPKLIRFARVCRSSSHATPLAARVTDENRTPPSAAQSVGAWQPHDTQLRRWGFGSSGLAEHLLDHAFRLLQAGSLQILLPRRHLFTKLLEPRAETLVGDRKHFSLFLGRVMNNGIP